MKSLAHSGLNGDTVYSACCWRHLFGDEPGEVILYFDPAAEASFTTERAANIAPLLEAQPYVSRVRFLDRCPADVDFDFAKWRHTYQPPANLAMSQAGVFGLPASVCDEPWLTVEPLRVAPVVVCRSARYHGEFPWRELAAKYRDDAVVVGTPQEYAARRDEFGFHRYYATSNLLECARVVAGCELLICNQTCVRAIGEGLKKRVAMEECARVPNCRFGRAGGVRGADVRGGWGWVT